MRAIVVSIAGASNADMSKLAGLLTDFANTPNISPEAQAMLRDLSKGPEVLSKIKKESH